MTSTKQKHTFGSAGQEETKHLFGKMKASADRPNGLDLPKRTLVLNAGYATDNWLDRFD
jgi:hypothetical protein